MPSNPDHPLFRGITRTRSGAQIVTLPTYVTKDEKARLASSCYAIRGGVRCDKGKDHDGDHHYSD